MNRGVARRGPARAAADETAVVHLANDELAAASADAARNRLRVATKA